MGLFSQQSEAVLVTGEAVLVANEAVLVMHMELFLLQIELVPDPVKPESRCRLSKAHK